MKNEQPVLTITERTQHRDMVLSCLSSLDWEDALDILAKVGVCGLLRVTARRGFFLFL